MDEQPLLNPQPPEEYDRPEFLAEGAYRFYRGYGKDQVKWDIAIPDDLRDPDLRVIPVPTPDGWHWSVTDKTKIKSRRGAVPPNLS